MANLQFVDFVIMPLPVRKEKQFRLSDDFFEFDFTILSRTNHSALGFPALFRVSYHGQRPLFGDPQNVLHDEVEARNFNISALRGRNCRLLAAVM